MQAYVENGNVFVTNMATKSEMQVTNDGDGTTIFYGASDWLYDAEIYETANNMVFSPDCSMLAFLKLNDTNVPYYQWLEYAINNPTPIIKQVRIPTVCALLLIYYRLECQFLFQLSWFMI